MMCPEGRSCATPCGEEVLKLCQAAILSVKHMVTLDDAQELINITNDLEPALQLIDRGVPFEKVREMVLMCVPLNIELAFT